MSPVWHSLAADIVRFLRDPLSHRVRQEALVNGGRNDIELGGRHLAHAMQAQQLALSGEHGAAIESMRSARADCLAVSADPFGDESQSDVWLHRKTLAGLADAFIAGQSLHSKSISSEEADRAMQSALKMRPDLPYLHRQRAYLLSIAEPLDKPLDKDRLEQALAALEQAHALDPTAGALDDASFAVELLLRAPDDTALVTLGARVKRGFIDPLSVDGRVSLKERSENLKKRSWRHFAKAGTEGKVEELFGRWERVLSVIELRTEFGVEGTGQLSVRKVAAAVAGADDVGLPPIAAAITRPPSPWQDTLEPPASRIVLELPTWLMPNDAAFDRISGTRGGGAREPTMAALQDEVQRRFGITLPSVLYLHDGMEERPKNARAAVSVVLDRRRLATELLPPETRFQFVPANASGGVTPSSRTPWAWFGRDVTPSDWSAEDFEAMLLVNVLAQRELLRCLDAFVGHATLTDLGLTDVDPELAPTLLQLLRSLASERTPLMPLKEHHASLLDWAGGCRDGSRSRIGAVEALREKVAVTTPLWGTEPGWRRCDIPQDLQDGLLELRRSRRVVKLVGPDARNAVLQWAQAELAQPRSVVVVETVLRPWVRALLRVRWPDVPVLAHRPPDVAVSAHTHA